MDHDEDETYLHLLTAKGKRARRREHSNFDPHRLRAYYDAQGWPEPSTLDMFRQLIKAYRHSCHAGCCTWKAYAKRKAARTERHQAKQALRRHIGMPARKDRWIKAAAHRDLTLAVQLS